MKAGDIIDCGDGMWNVRGAYRIGGIVNVGTQASLIRLPTGRFIWLDSLTLEGDTLQRVMAMTDRGRAVEAILNCHPFHTLHCEWATRCFPGAKLYGSDRHKKRMPHLKWEPENVESDAVARQYAEVLTFSLPRGVDYISADAKVHFSSLLARHEPSGTVHSDDTLTYLELPFPLSLAKKDTGIIFHPTLAKALEKRPGAAAEFHAWAEELAEEWGDSTRLCAAHNGVLDLYGDDFRTRVRAALAKVEPVLAAHERQFA